MTFSITKLSLMQSIAMLSVIYTKCHIQAVYPECRHAECRYAECSYAEYHSSVHRTCRYDLLFQRENHSTQGKLVKYLCLHIFNFVQYLHKLQFTSKSKQGAYPDMRKVDKNISKTFLSISPGAIFTTFHFLFNL
jgi:hypothetical protein